jgi:hypothetical protein
VFASPSDVALGFANFQQNCEKQNENVVENRHTRSIILINNHTVLSVFIFHTASESFALSNRPVELRQPIVDLVRDS